MRKYYATCRGCPAQEFCSGYSAHEFSALYSHLFTVGPSLPLDIRLETVLSAFLICLGVVTGADPLKPIIWNIWAGNIEEAGGGANPFKGLEDRTGFLDIRVRCSSTSTAVYRI